MAAILDNAPADIAFTGVRPEKSRTREAISLQLGRISFYGVVVTILASAIPYGTVEMSHKGFLVAAVAVFGIVRLLEGTIHGRFRIAEPALLAPLLGVIGLAAAQSVPLPFMGAAISLDPYETRSFILVFGSLIVCGEILFAYTDSAFRLKVLIALVIVAGLASALFGFLRLYVFDGENGLLAAYFAAGQGFAQFINRNHFAVLIEMSLGLIFGLLLKAEFNEKQRFAGWIAGGILIYSMIVANSRGGLMSLAAMALFAVFVHIVTAIPRSDHTLRKNGNWSIPKRIALASGACALVFGVVVLLVAFVGGDAVVTRIERVGGEVEVMQDSELNRMGIWTSTVEMIKARPVIGSGFGAYEAAVPAFDTSAGNYALRQAHNDYLELLASGGIVGFLLFAIFAALLTLRIRQNLILPDRFRAAACFGAVVGIFGVLIHSFVDFGLHVTVNALLFVVLIVIAVARITKTEGVVKEHSAYIRVA